MTLLSERTVSTVFTGRYSHKGHADQSVNPVKCGILWLMEVYFQSFSSRLLVVDELHESKNSAVDTKEERT